MLKTLFTIFAVSFALLLSVPLRAEEGAADSLQLFSAEDEQVVSTSRIPRPVSRIAENVTVITADDIARLNTHTVAEVLNTIPGVQLSDQRTPGSFSVFSIQGAGSQHVLVLIDGVPQNDLSDLFPDVGTIPVQHIDRIEIIKGAASAAWGSALGGVVNIITKSPDTERTFGAAGSASIGTNYTTDLRGEVAGTVKRFGYYLSGGNLHSDGLVAGNATNGNNFFSKLFFDLPNKGSLTFGFSYRNMSRGEFEAPVYNMKDSSDNRFIYGFLTLAYPLTDRLALEVTARDWHKKYNYWGRNFDDGQLTYSPSNSEAVRGINSKIFWGDSFNNLVAGLEYEHAEISQGVSLIDADLMSRTMDRWGAYANGALSFGPLTLLPGVRLDHTGIGSEYISYTLGATYRITDKTLLRSYGARGYGLPQALFLHGLQKVWTAQVGAESGDIPGLWVKGTLFYNDTWNVESSNYETNSIELKEQIKQGVELEGRTNPVAGLSFVGGYTFIHARDRDSGVRLTDTPGHLLKLGLNYDNSHLGFTGALTGNYAWVNADPGNNPADGTFIWDLHLTKKLLPSRDLSPEVFFSARNLFNGSQYWSDIKKNAPRWFEGGVRFKF